MGRCGSTADKTGAPSLNGHDRPVTIPIWLLRSGHSPGAICMLLFQLWFK
jgi:hypothetical protein